MMSQLPQSVFSVDLEDWFHILDVDSAPTVDQWGLYESRLERNTYTLLDIFDKKQVRCTLFVLGWTAERFPRLVQECAKRGHEIASHGYAHELVYEIGREKFELDVTRSKHLIEDVVGKVVNGYRAPGFSLSNETPWFFETLAKVGYTYDSSLFPAKRNHGGIANAKAVPHIVQTTHGEIIEFPMSLASTFGINLYFFGGGYLRLSPYALIKRKAMEVLAQDRPVIFYLHPREIDPGHPRLEMSATRRFMSYMNIATCVTKMEKLFDCIPMTTFADLIDQGVHLHTHERTSRYKSIDVGLQAS